MRGVVAYLSKEVYWGSYIKTPCIPLKRGTLYDGISSEPFNSNTFNKSLSKKISR